jgi:LysR family hydrogen peroxide-inducible transcriptional activator
MNLRDLTYLVAVAELNSFTKAAEQCHISQPTLSNQIKKLEEYLNVVLFERMNKKVMLTVEGAHIVESAKKILAEVNTIKHIAKCAQNPMSGDFRLGAFPTIASFIFPTLVTMLNQALPDLRLILVEDKTASLLEKLEKGHLDAAIIALPVNDGQMVSKKLFEEPFYLAVPKGHELCNHKAISQSMLKDYAIMLLEEGHCFRNQALDICQRYDIQEQNFRATSLETLKQMVIAGTGITFLPKSVMHETDENIVYIPFASPMPQRIIGLIWRKANYRGVLMERIADIWHASNDLKQ